MNITLTFLFSSNQTEPSVSCGVLPELCNNNKGITCLFEGILFICARVVSFAARSARAANDTTRAQINNIPEKSHVISNSNWTEWSTIQGVIGRVISKSAKRKARGRFEITSTITP